MGADGFADQLASIEILQLAPVIYLIQKLLRHVTVIVRFLRISAGYTTGREGQCGKGTLTLCLSAV
jgi:hypothetical protein